MLAAVAAPPSRASSTSGRRCRASTGGPGDATYRAELGSRDVIVRHPRRRPRHIPARHAGIGSVAGVGGTPGRPGIPPVRGRCNGHERSGTTPQLPHRVPPQGCAPEGVKHVPWNGHAARRRVRRLLQVDPNDPAPADLRPHRRPPRLARRGPGRLRRRLAPLAQGLPARGQGGLGPAAGVAARAAPPLRADLPPRPQAGPRRSAPPSTRSPSSRSPSARCCCSLSWRTSSLPDIAREVGLPLHEAERRLQLATSTFAMHREVPTTGIRPLLEPLREQVRDERWPRVTIVRRAGTTRRRTHTAVGAVAVVGALVLGGAVVTDAQGVKPSLTNARTTGVAAKRLGHDGKANTQDVAAEADAAPAVPAAVVEDHLVTVDQVHARMPGRWRETGTGGTGIMLPCQSTRFADPEGTSAASRRFKTPAVKHQPRRRMVQSVELSATNRRARTTYDAMLGWFGGCTDARTQLDLHPRRRRRGRRGQAARAAVLEGPREHDGRGRGPHRHGQHDHLQQGREHDPSRPHRSRPAARRRRQRAVPAARHRSLRRAAPALGGGARACGRRPRHAQRGRPAARERRRPAVDRHRGPGRARQPRGQPLRHRVVRGQGHEAEHDPVLRDPRGPALRPLRAHRDRRDAAPEEGSRLRGRRPQPAARVLRQAARHRRRPGGRRVLQGATTSPCGT